MITSIKQYQFQFHPYHLVEMSPWPLLTSFSLFSLTTSATMWFHSFSNSSLFLAMSFVLVVISMALWFRDVSIEGSYLGHHTLRVQDGLNLGFAMFVISEVFFFLSVFWAYFHSALAPSVELGGSFPPAGIEPLNMWSVPLLNTVILLSSGAAVTWSHHSIINGDRKGAILGLIVTIILALVFTGFQVIEYYEAPFNISDSVYGTTFFFSTGFHGIHVIVGTLMLGVSLFRMVNYLFTQLHAVGYETAIVYWHFVDVVWLFLYVSVYWWGS